MHTPTKKLQIWERKNKTCWPYFYVEVVIFMSKKSKKMGTVSIYPHGSRPHLRKVNWECSALCGSPDQIHPQNDLFLVRMTGSPPLLWWRGAQSRRQKETWSASGVLERALCPFEDCEMCGQRPVVCNHILKDKDSGTWLVHHSRTGPTGINSPDSSKPGSRPQDCLAAQTTAWEPRARSSYSCCCCLSRKFAVHTTN